MKKQRKKIPGPMSKFVVRVSMIEAWIAGIVCVVFCWFNKDVSSLTALLSVTWGGYELVKSAYIWMAKNEHIEEIRKGNKLDTVNQYLETQSEELKSEI